MRWPVRPNQRSAACIGRRYAAANVEPVLPRKWVQSRDRDGEGDEGESRSIQVESQRGVKLLSLRLLVPKYINKIVIKHKAKLPGERGYMADLLFAGCFTTKTRCKAQMLKDHSRAQAYTAMAKGDRCRQLAVNLGFSRPTLVLL